MPDKHKVLFLHIPKTAGTTFYDCLKQTYGKRRIAEFHGVPKNSIEDFYVDIYNPQKSEIACIKGHMYFGLHHYLDEASQYITFMRDPVKRIISLYRYLQQSPNHKQHEVAANKSLSEFAVDCHLHKNGQTRFLAGGNITDSEDALLARAQENLKNNFAVVGLTERFDESLVLMKNYLNWPQFPTYVQENISKKESAKQSIEPETLLLIEQHNAADIKLYQYAKTLFDQKIDAFTGDFRSELATFNKVQLSNKSSRQLYSTSRALYIGAKNKLVAFWKA